MYLGSAGMVCSVGLAAASACAAMRAGIAKFDELPYCDNQGEPVVGAVVPGAAAARSRDLRVLRLMTLALSDCLKLSEPLPKNSPLLVGLAEPDRPGGTAHLEQSLIPQLSSELGVQFNPRLSRAFPAGHTAGFEALRAARDLILDGTVDSCLVCGVDSYVNAKSLLWLEQHGRLKSAENSDGVIPGEAAAAIWLHRAPILAPAPAVALRGLGFGHEEVGVLSEQPLLGVGLSAAARAALTEAQLQLHEIAFRISDVTGEGYGFKEQSLSVSRLMRGRREAFPLWHPADSLGDTGAAAGVCQMVVACDALRNGYAPGSRAICFTSSVRGARAVAVTQRELREGGTADE